MISKAIKTNILQPGDDIFEFIKNNVHVDNNANISREDFIEKLKFSPIKDEEVKFVDDYYTGGGKGAIKEDHPVLGYYNAEGKAVIPYMRVVIKNKKVQR